MTRKTIYTQLGRFARVAGAAFVASQAVQSMLTGSTPVTREAVVGAAVAAVEVAYRAVRPTVTAQEATSAHTLAVSLVRGEVNRLLGGILAHGKAQPAKETQPAKAPTDSPIQ